MTQVVEGLSQADRELLRYALEAMVPQWVEYEPGKYVGVYLDKVPKLRTIEQSGFYYLAQKRSP